MNIKHKQAFIIWLAIYPLVTLLMTLLGDSLRQFPLPVSTLILTLIAVPVAFYVLIPLLQRILRNWLQPKRSKS